MELVRSKWVLLFMGGATALVAFVVLLVILIPWLFRFGQPPPQPVSFSHVPHVNAGAQCAFCHRGAQTGATAGIPSLEQCMFCHQIVARDNPEVQKVAAAYLEGSPIDWMRVHRLPDSVHFVHEPHLRAGLTCSACHGDVGAMTVVRPVRSLKMGDCLGCHRTSGGPTECSFCHY